MAAVNDPAKKGPTKAQIDLQARQKHYKDLVEQRTKEKIKEYQGWKDINDRRAAELAAATDRVGLESGEVSDAEEDTSAVTTKDSSAEAQLARFNPRKERQPSGTTANNGKDTSAGAQPKANTTAAKPFLQLSTKLPNTSPQSVRSPTKNAVSSTPDTASAAPKKKSPHPFGPSNGKKATKTPISSPGKKSASTSVPPLKQAESVVLSGSSGALKRSAPTDQPRSEGTVTKANLASIGKIQKRSSVASPQSPERMDESSGGILAGLEERPPKWYTDTATSTKRRPEDSDVSTIMERLRDAIRARSHDAVREHLHKLPFKYVNAPLLKTKRMLHNDGWLAQLFDTNLPGRHNWPYDIRSDAEELYVKWCRGVFDYTLLRGIIAGKPTAKSAGGDRNSDKLDPNYAGKVDFKAFGNNDLKNGQWFPTQLCTLRDGAHGASQGGVSGKLGEGAYCCIMTGDSHYPDEDNGDEVLYCGVDSDNGTVTRQTQMLLDSMTNKKPIRFIRKYSLKSNWAPELGFRYDGLYMVKSVEHMNEKPILARHRFHLVRCPGQDPIRGGSGPERRPTQEEVDTWRQDKHFRGF